MIWYGLLRGSSLSVEIRYIQSHMPLNVLLHSHCLVTQTILVQHVIRLVKDKNFNLANIDNLAQGSMPWKSPRRRAYISSYKIQHGPRGANDNVRSYFRCISR